MTSSADPETPFFPLGATSSVIKDSECIRRYDKGADTRLRSHNATTPSSSPVNMSGGPGGHEEEAEEEAEDGVEGARERVQEEEDAGEVDAGEVDADEEEFEEEEGENIFRAMHMPCLPGKLDPGRSIANR
eukprot:CAMPEP_0175084822 /NCGR_PEP_ID=MMETSP0052_2-20121109/28290_1 /TAXON_ID=51329 ORGANISM="Polytomella parva, Strain SAG 63-3" /NCGR_SAMPLE_ID=MMETSP0052_2 /ASSEMBLY_ACC=CAM_ASM_000194 /LENGTH=130 /DNA_ID=CAMNT_0016356703 /DNA_START=321 /DNA_END=713 /DNA_ORIENTATION=+